jgi:hypothetical protein
LVDVLDGKARSCDETAKQVQMLIDQPRHRGIEQRTDALDRAERQAFKEKVVADLQKRSVQPAGLLDAYEQRCPGQAAAVGKAFKLLHGPTNVDKTRAATTEPLPVQVDDAAVAVAKPEAPSFERFVIVDFNWEAGGSDVLVINSDGSGRFSGAVREYYKDKGVASVRSVWHLVDWQVAPDALKRLVKKIDEIGFSKLEALYIDRGVDDGQSSAAPRRPTLDPSGAEAP